MKKLFVFLCLMLGMLAFAACKTTTGGSGANPAAPENSRQENMFNDMLSEAVTAKLLGNPEKTAKAYGGDFPAELKGTKWAGGGDQNVAFAFHVMPDGKVLLLYAYSGPTRTGNNALTIGEITKTASGFNVLVPGDPPITFKLELGGTGTVQRKSQTSFVKRL